ncbi:serglycin [Zonotrichia leucophrys gambelii]|uniref:serglycin n=1 Tax=Zonotrichia leucophrys gambelii TaxID=257770 RepID=UPI0003942F2B|nr:serglycin [Zonotrichia albicollis]
MPAKMQLLIRWNGRICLAVCLILFVGCTAQGAPAQRARYKRVRCRSDPWSANCIEEQGPWFHMPSGGANRILPPGADPFLMKRYQELGDIFPLSSEDAGSGSNTVVEAEPASGSGLGDSDSFPALLESLRGSELQEKLSEEDLLL